MLRYASALVVLAALALSAQAQSYVVAQQYLDGAVVRVVAVRVLPVAQSTDCGCKSGLGCSCPSGQCFCGPDCPCGQATAAAARQQQAVSYSSLPVVRYSTPTYSYTPQVYYPQAVRYSAPSYSMPSYYAPPSYGYSSFGGGCPGGNCGVGYGYSSFGGGCPGGVCR